MAVPRGEASIPSSQWNVKQALDASPAATTAVPIFMNTIYERGTASDRHRELAILRVAAVCRSDYEWGRHVLLSRERAGLDDDTLQAVRSGDLTKLAEADAVVVRLAEAVVQRSVDDDLRGELARHFDAAQRAELILLASFYVGLACAIDAFGVELDEDIALGLAYP